MKLAMDGGLNLNDSKQIAENETSLSQNADYRQKGLIRSRNGSTTLYSSQGVTLIGGAQGFVYSVDTDVYKNGTALSASGVSAVTALGVCKLRNVQTEALLISGTANKKVEGSTVTNWGISEPSAIPTIALSGTGITGSYYYRYTYVRKSGSTIVAESNPSSASLIASPVNQTVDVTWTVSSDSQVTHVRLYRTLNGGSATSYDFYYLTEVAIGTTTYADAVADTSLGALVETDNDIPPSTSLSSITGPGAFNTIFIATGNTVYFSKVGRPESFPALYFFNVGTPNDTIMALVDWAGLIFIFTKTAVYLLQGTDPDTFYPVKTMASRGLAAKQGIWSTEKGIVYTSYDGIYAFNGQSEVCLTRDKVDPLFRGESVNGVSPVNLGAVDSSWLVYFNGKMFYGYCDSTYTTPNKVLVYDFDEFKFSIFDYGRQFKSAFVDIRNNRVLAGDTSGNLIRLETGEDDNGSAFTFKVRGKELPNISHVTPSYARYDITNEGGNSVEVRYLSKTISKYSHTITDTETHKRRVLKGVALDSFQVEVESSVSSRVSVGVIELE